MATNKLAPKSQNALLLESAQAYPEYQEIAKFLGPKLPQPKYAYLSDGVRGKYTYAPFFGKEPATIEVNSEYADRRRGETAAVPTVVHESVHALQGPLQTFYLDNYKSPATPEMQQFVDAYNKLEFTRNKNAGTLDAYPRGAMAAKLGGMDWFKKNKDYRTSEVELPAQAMGNVFASRCQWPGTFRPHTGN